MRINLVDYIIDKFYNYDIIKNLLKTKNSNKNLIIINKKDKK